VGYEHCTRYGETTSTVLDIAASIVQGSAIGPASYVVNAADLTTMRCSSMLMIRRHSGQKYPVQGQRTG